MKWSYASINFGVDLSGKKDHRCWVCWLEKRPPKIRARTSPTEIAEATGTGEAGYKSLWICLKHWQKYKKCKGIKRTDATEGIIEIMDSKR